MKDRRVFLSAEWRDLILFNFAVPDEALTPHLPKGVELDRWDGKAHVSLVAFDFLKTKVLGIAWPGHTNFAEINLRFYCKRQGIRGVSFIREIVPQPLIAGIARVIYNEPYVAAPIRSETKRENGRIAKKYTLRWRGREHVLGVTTKDERTLPKSDGIEHYFKEHEWGFGKARNGETVVYRVDHPHWEVHPAGVNELSFDFGAVYGDAWAFLTGRQPDSVCFAAGSAIKVYAKD